MLLIKTYYFIFSAFIYAIAGLCEALHYSSKRQWNPIWKRRLPLKRRLVTALRLHQAAGNISLTR